MKSLREIFQIKASFGIIILVLSFDLRFIFLMNLILFGSEVL